MLEYMPYIWTAVLILCVLIEAATAGLTAIWFMPAALVCLVLSIFNIKIGVQIIIFIAVGALMLILSKTVFKNFFKKAQKTPTNADRLIGQTALVTATINNEQPSGEVLVGWQHWTARSDDGSIIPEGASVKVIRIEGVKLIVHATDTAHGQ